MLPLTGSANTSTQREQSWLQFLTPGEFDFCHNQEPGAFHDMEVWGLDGDCPLLSQDVTHENWS